MASDGLEELDDMIRRIREIPKLANDAAPECADAARDALTANLSAGTDPYGQAWKPTADGHRPLVGAAAAVKSAAVGTTIYFRLVGHEVFHNAGTSRVPQRRILPDGEIPPAMAQAIKGVLERRFAERVGGG